MKKYLRYADGMVLLFGALAMLLRIWLLRQGTDARGLYPRGHISMILLTLLVPLVLGALWLLTQHAGNNKSYRANFPASPIAAAGIALGGLSIGYIAYDLLGRDGVLAPLTGVAGLIAAAALLLCVPARLQGKRQNYISLLLCCVFFALRLFYMGQELGAEPEMHRYLPRFLVSIAVIPAVYLLWGFCVGEGNRKYCLLFCLSTAFLALAAVPGSQEWPMYLGIAFWMLTGMPVLKDLPRQTKEDSPLSVQEVQETPPEEEAPDDLDVEQILAELLQDTQSPE